MVVVPLLGGVGVAVANFHDSESKVLWSSTGGGISVRVQVIVTTGGGLGSVTTMTTVPHIDVDSSLVAVVTTPVSVESNAVSVVVAFDVLVKVNTGLSGILKLVEMTVRVTNETDVVIVLTR